MNKAENRLSRRRLAERRGRRSETWAALVLLLKGYRILGRRVRTPVGEIDLIAQTPAGIICFIEVKARRVHDDAVLSLGARQQARIARAAALYLAGRPQLGRKGMRFDTVIVARGAWPKHFRDAWRPESG
jgi:putative endonuclease